MLITIRRSILPINPRYLAEWASVNGIATLRLDYMGQILQQLGHTIPHDPKAKLASDLLIAIPPFTRMVRGQVVQTDLASDILALPLSPESEKRLAEWLALKDYTVQFTK